MIPTRFKEQSLVITAGAYAANDVIGGLIKFDAAASNGGFVIRNLKIVDANDTKAGLTIYFFRDEPSSIADNAAFAPNEDDVKKIMAELSVSASNYKTLNGTAYALFQNQVLSLDCENQYVWVYIVTTGTPTYGATDDLTLQLELWSDD